jgi:hypothetical protein
LVLRTPQPNFGTDVAAGDAGDFGVLKTQVALRAMIALWGVVVVHYAIIPRITRLNKPARMAVSAQTARWFRLMRPKSTAKGVALTQLVDLNAHTRGFSKLCVTADCRPPLWLRLDQLTLIASASLPLRLAT